MRKGHAARVRRAIDEILSHHNIDLAQARSAQISFSGAGLFRTGYQVALVEATTPIPEQFVVLIPHEDISPDIQEAWQREIRILQFLEQQQFSFGFPRLLFVTHQNGLPILITEYITGCPLDGKLFPVNPQHHLEAVARVAAAVHELPRDPFLQIAPGTLTCREFALSSVAKFRNHSDPDIANALARCDDHLPPEEPTVILHGDLLGQNLLINVLDPTSVSVIDWTEARTGDPAYEFAILTRGVRKPLKGQGELSTLLARYTELSARTIDPKRVRFYEVTLVIGWLAHYLENDPLSKSVESERIRLRALTQ